MRLPKGKLLDSAVPYHDLDERFRKLVDVVLAALHGEFDVPAVFTATEEDMSDPSSRSKACKAVLMGAMLVVPFGEKALIVGKASTFDGILKSLGYRDVKMRNAGVPYVGNRNIYCREYAPTGYNAYALAFVPTEDQMRVIVSGRRIGEARIP